MEVWHNIQIASNEAKLERCLIALRDRALLVDSYRIVRYMSRFGAAVVSASAKIPYIPIALQLDEILGPFAVFGNTAGFFILEFWAANGTINDILGPKTQAEKDLTAEKIGIKLMGKRVIVISTASLLAIASQLPTTLAGVNYNEERFKILAGIVLLIAGSLIPARSLQLSIEQINLGQRRALDYKIAGIQSKMVALLHNNRALFLQKNWEEKQAFITSLNPLRNQDTDSCDYLLALTGQNNSALSLSKKITRTVFNYLGLGIGLGLAGIFEFALGEFTYTETKNDLVDNDIAAGFFASAAIGATAYLFGQSIMRTSQRIFNVMGNAITGQEVKNLGWQLRPKLSFALTALGLFTDICALGPTYVIWGNYYDENPYEQRFFQSSMCASLFLLLFTSTLDIIDDIVGLTILWGTDEEKEVLRLDQEFQRAAAVIQHASTQEFLSYFLNNGQQQAMRKRLEITDEQFNALAEDKPLISTVRNTD